uniref:Uncharacterized protein n=1 Tax=Palpitomonas bilix TaxID=652834 RepID=A0A7S3D4W6_9EUKA|mmetsp:Transcript_22228/g.57238  ORF Transcript_22228/g.57238 Transcript_22228/m.57238 type:complete len:537 (+) Transcript_22228:150-1760(+)|eukprot:CAMPEP_0113887364 /NCGR_PEP_ID=MMETSP0780_2-20120614/12173_1 /TAXON_ID=652834 /ORGANISM="Palpitomonas bilix" /LENGTH=536 /DNA_ID=CAMNT_0000875889 /DNA_START=151 /DNA_END=1761 /DNA_ORIENTATION=- /assembly_acc=CAM_ASM_000599
MPAIQLESGLLSAIKDGEKGGMGVLLGSLEQGSIFGALPAGQDEAVSAKGALSWISAVAKDMSTMTVGGMNIVGVYFHQDWSEFEKSKSVVSSSLVALASAIFRSTPSLTPDSSRGGSVDSVQLVLLNVNPKNKRHSVRSVVIKRDAKCTILHNIAAADVKVVNGDSEKDGAYLRCDMPFSLCLPSLPLPPLSTVTATTSTDDIIRPFLTSLRAEARVLDNLHFSSARKGAKFFGEKLGRGEEREGLTVASWLDTAEKRVVKNEEGKEISMAHIYPLRTPYSSSDSSSSQGGSVVKLSLSGIVYVPHSYTTVQAAVEMRRALAISLLRKMEKMLSDVVEAEEEEEGAERVGSSDADAEVRMRAKVAFELFTPSCIEEVIALHLLKLGVKQAKVKAEDANGSNNASLLRGSLPRLHLVVKPNYVPVATYQLPGEERAALLENAEVFCGLQGEDVGLYGIDTGVEVEAKREARIAGQVPSSSARGRLPAAATVLSSSPSADAKKKGNKQASCNPVTGAIAAVVMGVAALVLGKASQTL